MTQDNLRRILGARDGETVAEAAQRAADMLDAWRHLPITGAQSDLLARLVADPEMRRWYE